MSEPLDSVFDERPNPSNDKRIMLANLVILAIYTIFCFAFPKNGGSLLDAILIVIHVSLCVLLGIIMTIASKGDSSKGFFLSALLVLLIGFGSCLAVSSLTQYRIPI